MASAAFVNDEIVASPPFAVGADPLGPDETSDAMLRLSERGLVRVALIAAETGARFQREGVEHDPMAWLLAPRRLFRGQTAMEACLRLEDFERALILHGLSLGFDADPEDVDGLRSDEDEQGGDDCAGRADEGDRCLDVNVRGAAATPQSAYFPLRVEYETTLPGLASGEIVLADSDRREGAARAPGAKTKPPSATGNAGGDSAVILTLGPRRLCSASAVLIGENVNHLVFHASFAASTVELRDKIAKRFGPEIAEAADLRVGFDPGHPLLPPAIARFLEEASSWPDRDLPLQVNVNFERHVER